MPSSCPSAIQQLLCSRAQPSCKVFVVLSLRQDGDGLEGGTAELWGEDWHSSEPGHAHHLQLAVVADELSA